MGTKLEVDGPQYQQGFITLRDWSIFATICRGMGYRIASELGRQLSWAFEKNEKIYSILITRKGFFLRSGN